MKPRRGVCILVAAGLLLGGCSAVPHAVSPKSPVAHASADLTAARRRTLSTEKRAALYLEAAALATPRIDGPGGEGKAALAVYNSAAAELTGLLHGGEGGRFWNRPLAVAASGTNYVLRFTPKTKTGTWSPNEFTSFKPAQTISCRRFAHHYQQAGFGGTLVGIRKTSSFLPLGQHTPFEPRPGLTAPVTATLDFHGREVSLTLRDPAVSPAVNVQGKPRPLAADFTAPFAYYPTVWELWYGLMGLVKVDQYMSYSGLYMIQPYDPNRIPVILVHGLISTPQMWKNVVNELEADPQLRGRFQYWVFCYPTGNPPAYSALLCRDELARMQKRHPMPQGCILVGHSMGGLISRMQATTTGRALWDANFREKAGRIYARLPEHHVVKRSLIFTANPEVKRVVFICVPHRGSQMAMGSLGAIAMRLISLPATMVTTLHQSLADVIKTSTGRVYLPNSISGLSPKNETLVAMDKLAISAPYHSIIGDRGKGDTPRSSDGVVPYWSSHLEGARSECIVPGPHGSYELPQTVAELKRILGEHLKSTRRNTDVSSGVRSRDSGPACGTGSPRSSARR
jgi:pimeloyl-ACP methyl ester carboxylesterase